MKNIIFILLAAISMTIGCVGEEQSIDDRYDTTTQANGLRLMGSNGNECAYAGTVRCQSPWGGTTYHNHTEYYYVQPGEACPAAISVSWSFGDDNMGSCMGDVVLVNDLLDAEADEAVNDHSKTTMNN